jgi:hypothetical protein
VTSPVMSLVDSSQQSVFCDATSGHFSTRAGRHKSSEPDSYEPLLVCTVPTLLDPESIASVRLEFSAVKQSSNRTDYHGGYISPRDSSEVVTM